MDFTSFMAGFALLAFWLNTLLIAGAGLIECRDLRRRYAGRFVAGAAGRALERSRIDPVS